MTCPQCQAENRRTAAASAGPESAPQSQSSRTLPILPIAIAGAVVLFFGFLVIVGLGAYVLTRHQAPQPVAAAPQAPAAQPQAAPAPAPTPPPEQQPQTGQQPQVGPIPAPPQSAQPQGAPAPTVAGQQPQPGSIPEPPAAPAGGGAQGGGGQAPQQNTVPMANYAIGKLVVKYPAGWHVLASQVSGYVFYKDDPYEGTAFTVLPLQTVGGELGAPQVVTNAAGGLFGQKYADFRVTNVSVNVVQSDFWGAGQVSEADAAWTGTKRQPMRARLWGLSVASGGATTFMFMAGQAPAADFDQWRNVFEDMFYK